MYEIFLKIFNMSISASYIVLAVLLFRLLLKKAPKWITVVLWGIVAVRLVCPFSIESVLSLIPSSEVVSPNIMTDKTPTINTGIPIINSTINPVISESFTPNPGDSANPLQIWIPILTAVWVVGMVALLIYTVISYVRVRRKIGTAVLYKDNIFQSENVVSPFVLGIIKPKIYLPFKMSEKDMEHVVAHEMAHIRRKDHIWKPLGFLLLTIHWFNPLMWLGYVLLCRDIELACDEKVIKELDHDARADYSQVLLTCSVNRRMIAACPLAFGEVGVKDRVKSVLNYKKPAFWVITVAVVACVVVAVCFLTNPINKSSDFGETDPDKMNEEQVTLMEQYPEYFGLDASDGLDVYVWQMAKDCYSFGLLPHSEQGRYWIANELLNLRGTRSEDMSVILSTYNVNENDIYIIPWQNPTSSYICDWQIVIDDEDPDAKKQAYVEYIRQMLFEGDLFIGAGTTENGEQSSTIDLIFDEPSLSWVTSYVPNVTIRGEKLYDANNEELLGDVLEIALSPTIFEQLINNYQGQFSEIAQDIQQNNEVIYSVNPVDSHGVGLYYVLIQNDGDIILVYGHYENGVKSDFIRWIFEINK